MEQLEDNRRQNSQRIMIIKKGGKTLIGAKDYSKVRKHPKN